MSVKIYGLNLAYLLYLGIVSLYLLMTGLFSQEIQIIDFVSVNDKLELCLEKLTLNIILKFRGKKSS